MPPRKERRGGSRPGAGRKSPFAGLGPTKSIWLQLPEAIVKRIDAEAKDRGVSRAVVVADRFGPDAP